MSLFPKHKKFITFLAVLVLVTGVFFVTAYPVLATSHAAQSTQQKSLLGDFLKGTVGLPVATAALGIFLLLQQLMIALLGFSSYLLANAFVFNLAAVPSAMTVVITGWRVMRDIGNGLFILIILWVAFTIIFDIEQLGGKKLLWRVVVIALLMNFSLAFVSAVFGFSNFVAKIFADKIQITDKKGNNTYDIAGFVVSATKIHTIMNTFNEKGADAVRTFYKEQEEKTKARASAPNTWSLSDTALASMGVQPADAVAVGGLAGCGLGALFGLIIPVVGSIVGCAGFAIAGAAADAWFGISSNLYQTVAKQAVNTGIATIFLGLLTSAFVYGAIALISRIVMIVFISIFAPAVFMLYIIPGNLGAKYRKMWGDALIQWSFFAPAYYFMIYLGLFMLQQFNGSEGRNQLSNFNADVDRMLQLVVIVFFFYSAGKYAKQMGGVVADVITSTASKVGSFAMGYATGGVSLAAGAAGGALARRAAPALEGRLAGRIPLLKSVGGIAERKLTRYVVGQKAKIDEKKGQYKSFSPDQLKRTYDLSTFAEDKVALATLLAEKGKFNELPENKQKDALRLASQFGTQDDILKARPDLATAQLMPGAGVVDDKDAIQKKAKSLRGEDFAKIDTVSVKNVARDTAGNARRDEARTGIWLNTNFSPSYLGSMANKDLDAAEAMVEHLQGMINKFDTGRDAAGNALTHGALDELKRQLDPLKKRFDKYLNGSPGAHGAALGLQTVDWKSVGRGPTPPPTP